MLRDDMYIFRGKCIITLAVFCLIASISINFYEYNKEQTEEYVIAYENINIKDMAVANVAEKKESEKSSSTGILQINNKLNNSEVPKEVSIDKSENSTTNTPQAVNLETQKDSLAAQEVPKRIWYLPCERGIITSTVTYSHYAIDITSPRGTNEAIYPIANGVISSIYNDNAGAKIVTVNHNIDGKAYSSQYVHLSRYAPNLYVGKEVTVNDYLGYMGMTGIATGVHLHLAVVDCSVFNPADKNCANLNGFFNYGRIRLSQGFKGPYSVMDIPSSWTSR